MKEDDQNVPCNANPICSIYKAIRDEDCYDANENIFEDELCTTGSTGTSREPILDELTKLTDITSNELKEIKDKELHIAPMLDYSKREFRKLFSILSTRLVVWTDMVVDDTITHSDHLDDILEPDRDLKNKQVCQIGGSSPELCGNATQVVVVTYGYDEVNLNIDCPSDRVSREREFGAALMKKVEIAYTVLESMQRKTSSYDSEGEMTPVSIKCRIGVDELDNFDFISGFIERLVPVCRRFCIHARKCVLNGLYSARQNRSVPPINYPRVYALCRKFPQVEFWINGGIRSK